VCALRDPVRGVSLRIALGAGKMLTDLPLLMKLAA